MRQLIKSIKSNHEIPFAKECICLILNGEVIANNESIASVERLLRSYNEKKHIQEEITKKELVLGFDFIIEKLNNFNDKKELIKTIIIAGPKSGFIILQSVSNSKIIGILKTFNITLNKFNEIIKIYQERGYTANYKRFNKGENIPLFEKEE